MDAQQLFWATGINNTSLDTDAKAAVQIFSRLQKDVKAELEKIEKAYEATRMKTNLKFTNPVDPSMVESIKAQMRELGKVIDEQTKAVAGLSLSYDKAMQNINKSASRVGRGTGSGSPLQPTVDNVRSSVAQADRELSFLERRFKYAASSIVAYGSFRWGQQFIADMIKVKGEFDQLRVAIDSFTGSAENGAKVFGQLTRLAVKSPFELRDITNSAKQLLAYGTAAEDVADSIKMLSDVSAGSGQSIKDIAYLYGTSLTQGRLYARDLFQFANRGIPIYGELAKVMGISTKELMEQVKIGKVGFPQLQAAMENMTAAGGKYFGLSDKIAATTFGKISNLKDKWSIALNEMGNATDGVVSTTVEGITVLLENWEQVVKAIEAAVIAYGSYRAAMAVGALISQVQTANALARALGTTVTATGTLSSAWKSLTATMALNPITAASVAIGVLVASVWLLHDSTTSAEKAQKRFDESMKRITGSAEAEKAAFDELLNTVKNVNEAGDKRQRAYDKLKETYPDIIKNMTFENVVAANSVKLTKERNEQLAYSEYMGKRVLAVQAKRALLEAKQHMENVKGTSQASYEYAAKKYDEALEFYNLAKKESDDAIKAREEAAKRQKSTPIVKNKEYWEEQKKEAEAALELLTKADVGSKKWNELVAKIKEAERELKTWDLKEPKTKTDPVTTQQQKAEEMLAKIKENDAKLTDAAKQAEIDRQQATVDGMIDGHAKALKQLELNYEKEKAKIKEEGDKLLKIEQDTAYKRWLIENPNWKKEKKTFAMPTDLSTESQGTISTMYGTANMNYLNSQKDMLQKMLIELGNFDEQMNEIDRKYNDQIEFLRKSRTENNKKEVDDAIAQAQRLAEEEKAKLSLEEFQKDINWGDVFSDLSALSTKELSDLQEKIQKLVSEFAGSFSKTDAKALSDSLKNINDELFSKNPIGRMIQVYKNDALAKRELKEARDELTLAQQKYNEVMADSESTIGELIMAEVDLKEARDKANAAESKNDVSGKNLASSYDKELKSIQGVGSALQTVSSTLDGIGASDSLKTYVSSVSDIVEGGVKGTIAMRSGDVAGMVEGAIQQTKGYVNLVNEMFGGNKANRYYANLKEELGEYIDVLEQVIDSQKEVMDAMVGPAAITASEEVTDAIEQEIESYRKLAEAAGNAGAGMFSHSYAYRTDERLEDYFDDISKSAGETVDSVTDLYYMTPQQLEKIRDENAYAWSLINEDIRDNLDAIIEAGEELEEVYEQANAALTGLSFDAAQDSLDDLLKDADTTFEDVADNFEEYMQNAILNMVKSEYLDAALAAWYDDFVDKTKSGNELTQAEVEELRQAYMDIYNTAQSQYDALLDAADVQLTSSNSSTSGAISSMSQESADILTAQFSAIRIDVSDILLTLQNQGPLLEMAVNDISEIAKNTRDLADIKKYLGYMWDQGIKIK